jgi:hypothetical protein
MNPSIVGKETEPNRVTHKQSDRAAILPRLGTFLPSDETVAARTLIPQCTLSTQAISMTDAMWVGRMMCSLVL